jgi:hypothetical protein
MIVTRKHLPRRTFLRGLGAAVGLPLLDSMSPAFAGPAPTGATAPLRLSFVYVPNGIVMENWTPKTAGRDFEFTPILKALEPLREDTLVLSKLMNYQANALGDGGGDHARAGASFLTGAHPKKTGGSDIYAGVSADQVAAQAFGGRTRLASLELGLDDSRVVGHCDSGYSCAYTNSISWKSPTTPLPPEASPRLLFERLFGDADPSIDAETRTRRARYRKSLLDATREETAKLARAVGPADRRKIDEYLDSVREIERRIQMAESDGREVAPTIDKPAGIPAGYDSHAKLLFDLQFVAFQADLTRVTTMVMGREGSVRTYGEIGVPEPHHPLSHHRGMADALEKLTRINAYHVGLFAHFIRRLKETPEGERSLLDRSMIVYGCGISDSNRHTHDDLPVLVVGRGNGRLDTGRHVAMPEDTPVTNLYLTLLDRAGVSVDRLGDSTGKLEI